MKIISSEKTVDAIHATQSVGISELKLNPTAVIEGADGGAVAILNRNKPVAYLLPADQYEALLDRLEDYELADIVRARQNEPLIEVDIHK
ncbi:MAG: type toxin-antitoxin system prevent-host-death family antitoxin [Caballeronia sp.]|nr:type toxin-antitoxin system prevent-host-death family antitoxin [Caballeronia sp.]